MRAVSTKPAYSTSMHKIDENDVNGALGNARKTGRTYEEIGQCEKGFS